MLESDSPSKLINEEEEDLGDEDEENDLLLEINTFNDNPTKEGFSLALNNSIIKNSNGKRVSFESDSNLNSISHLNTNGNYILNKIGMIKSLSEQQNKIRILGK